MNMPTFLNDGFELTGAAFNYRFSQADLDSLKGIEDKSWYDYFWKNGKVQRHTVTVSGGTDKIHFLPGEVIIMKKVTMVILKTINTVFVSGMNATIIDGLTADVSFASDFNKEAK